MDWVAVAWAWICASAYSMQHPTNCRPTPATSSDQAWVKAEPMPKIRAARCLATHCRTVKLLRSLDTAAGIKPIFDMWQASQPAFDLSR